LDINSNGGKLAHFPFDGTNFQYASSKVLKELKRMKAHDDLNSDFGNKITLNTTILTNSIG
jgi:hypothetical protein